MSAQDGSPGWSRKTAIKSRRDDRRRAFVAVVTDTGIRRVPHPCRVLCDRVGILTSRLESVGQPALRKPRRLGQPSSGEYDRETKLGQPPCGPMRRVGSFLPALVCFEPHQVGCLEPARRSNQASARNLVKTINKRKSAQTKQTEGKIKTEFLPFSPAQNAILDM